MLEAGIDPASVLDPEFRVAVVNMWKLWRLSVERTGNDAFGLQVAANLYPHTSMPWSLPCRPAPLCAKLCSVFSVTSRW